MLATFFSLQDENGRIPRGNQTPYPETSTFILGVQSIGVELESLAKGGLIAKLIFALDDPGQTLNILHLVWNKKVNFWLSGYLFQYFP